MSQFYIEDGININPLWEKHIAISIDGVRWETFAKEGLNVIPVISSANTASPTANKSQKCTIYLKRTGEDNEAFFFDIDNVQNQPAWTGATTIIGKCIAAVDDITTWLGSCCSGGGALPIGAATESTLQSVLGAIQDGQDFESKLVIDDNGNGSTYLEVRIWNPDTQTWETPLYYSAGSNVGVTAGTLTAPIIYINCTSLLSAIASNTTLFTVTHTPVISSGVGNIPAGTLRGSILNSGNAAGIWGGVSIPAGVGIPWGDTGTRDTYNAIAYDATGTTFIIEYTA